MDGEELQVGAIAGVERVKNPIAVARAVLASPHVLLVGTGAELFAKRAGIALCAPERWSPRHSAPVGGRAIERGRRGRGNGHQRLVAVSESAEAARERRWASWCIGMPTSTAPSARLPSTRGGTSPRAPRPAASGTNIQAALAIPLWLAPGSMPRMHSAASQARAMAKTSCDCYWRSARVICSARGCRRSPAASTAIRLLGERTDGHGGLVLLDRAGRVGYARNTRAMAHAYIVAGMAGPFAGRVSAGRTDARRGSAAGRRVDAWRGIVLALDQGTTSSRAMLFDVAGDAVAMSHQEFPQHLSSAGVGGARSRGHLVVTARLRARGIAPARA